MFDICKTGFPGLIRQGLASLSTVVLNNTAGVYGDAAVAAMSIVNRICFFTFATALGIGQGFQPVCSFNYGAKKYDRVRKAFIFSFMVGEIFLGTIAFAGMFFTAPLIHMFRDDIRVVEIGALALNVQFIGQLFQPLAVCSNMMFQSVGKAKIATFLSMLRNGLFFLPLIFVLSKLFGLVGVQITQGISDVLTMFVALPFAVKFLREMSRY